TLAKQSLRVPIQQTLNISGVGTVLTGRVSSGILKPNTDALISPTKQSIVPVGVQIKTIQAFHKDIPQGEPGDNVGFQIKAKNVGSNDIIRGAVLSDPSDPAEALKPNVDGFLSLVLVVRGLGKKAKKKDDSWGQGERGMVWMTPLNPLVVEPLAKSPALGRFALRDSGKTVAVGVVQKIERGKYAS
ncbi:MAG: elongation factor 1-alpha C-terminal domain-related protein, partial [Candidatus Hodarchaeales archaeon]